MNKGEPAGKETQDYGVSKAAAEQALQSALVALKKTAPYNAFWPFFWSPALVICCD